MALEEYIQLCAVERQKSSIYSHLFTLFVTIIGGLMAYYAQNPDKNAKIITIVPLLMLIWFAFILFNNYYLKIVRASLIVIEEKSDEIQYKWYSDIFKERISLGISKPLYVVCLISLIAVAALCIIIGYEGLIQFLQTFETYKKMTREQITNVVSIYYIIYILFVLIAFAAAWFFTNLSYKKIDPHVWSEGG